MDGETYRVYDEKMIDELMIDNGLSDFLSIAEKGEMAGTIHAYGAYTLFAPTNEAVKTYLSSIGKSSVDDLSKDEAASMVKYHLINDTTLTADFLDGRLPSPNFLKQYLTTKAEIDGIYVNREAKILTKDLRGSNGYLQIVDKMLTPPQQTIADRIKALPDAEYSFMKSLFEMSGLEETLSVIEPDNWFTFFIQDNNTFKEAGIETVEDLLVELRSFRPDIEDDRQLIHDYVAYHSVNRLLYIADLLVVSSLQTLVPKQVITFKRSLDVIILNELVQGSNVEQGIPLDRKSEYTDLSCSNGVIQKIDGNIQIKNRTAYRIYWDITEQPELMALKTFRKAGTTVTYKAGELSEITWGGKSPGTLQYTCFASPQVIDSKSQYVYCDYLRFRMCTSTIQWMEMKTPVLIEGSYKVWLCYRREQELRLKSIFKQEGYDDQVLPYIFDLSAYMPNPSSSSHEQLEIDGWKQYSAKAYNSVTISHLLGIIKVETTGRHTLRFEATHAGRNSGNWDIIQFIPINDDQLWPRMDMKGNWIGPEVPVCEIFPADCKE
jgi:uncharacterized surface protein with fasciclin (FAS1) repeats